MRISTVKNNAHAQFLRKIAVPDYERFQRVPHQYVGHYYKNGSGKRRSRFDMTEPLDFSRACHDARLSGGAAPCSSLGRGSPHRLWCLLYSWSTICQIFLLLFNFSLYMPQKFLLTSLITVLYDSNMHHCQIAPGRLRSPHISCNNPNCSY